MMKRRAEASSFVGFSESKIRCHRRKLSRTKCSDSSQSDECEIVNVKTTSKSLARTHNFDTSMKVNLYDIRIPRLPPQDHLDNQALDETTWPCDRRHFSPKQNRVERTATADGLNESTDQKHGEQSCENENNGASASTIEANSRQVHTPDVAKVKRAIKANNMRNETERRDIKHVTDDETNESACGHGDAEVRNNGENLETITSYPANVLQPLVSQNTQPLNNPAVESYPWSDPRFLSLVNYNLYQMQAIDSMVRTLESSASDHPTVTKSHDIASSLPAHNSNNQPSLQIAKSAFSKPDNFERSLQTANSGPLEPVKFANPTKCPSSQRDFVSEVYRLRQLGRVDNITTNFSGQNTYWTCHVQCDVKKDGQAHSSVNAVSSGSSRKRAKHAACEALLQKIVNSG